MPKFRDVPKPKPLDQGPREALASMNGAKVQPTPRPGSDAEGFMLALGQPPTSAAEAVQRTPGFLRSVPDDRELPGVPGEGEDRAFSYGELPFPGEDSPSPTLRKGEFQPPAPKPLSGREILSEIPRSTRQSDALDLVSGADLGEHAGIFNFLPDDLRVQLLLRALGSAETDAAAAQAAERAKLAKAPGKKPAFDE